MNSRNPIYRPKSPPPWDSEKPYFKGDHYFKDVLNAIRHSRQIVDFEVYIYEKGLLADRVTSALIQAARRGVKVRLLVDGIGSPDCAADYGEKLKKGGVRFRVYRRLPPLLNLFSRPFASLFTGKAFYRLRHFWFRVNRRNHRKLVMVDGHRVWLGGFNVSDEHLESVAGPKAWRDTGLRLSGVKDRAFRLAFNTAWHDQVHRRLWRFYRRQLIAWLSRKSSANQVQINATRRLRIRFHRELLGRLRSARRRIWVTTPYFVPTLPVLRALLHAALQGRDVRLILPEKSDIPFVRWASMTFFPPLLKAGCRIFEYHRSILHAKTLLVDDWALVGSSNFNHRSFLFDLEVDVVSRKPASLKSLERQGASDFRRSREIRFVDLKLRPLWTRILTWLFFRLRHWL
ncbi:MAG TPA: phospholipase D-like domain-containing protein [bacterium]|nr:phospholipase D-like domain-containing protein [bacterium]